MSNSNSPISHEKFSRLAAWLILLPLVGCGYEMPKGALPEAATADYALPSPRANPTDFFDASSQAGGPSESFRVPPSGNAMATGGGSPSNLVSSVGGPPSPGNGDGNSGSREIPQRKIIQNHTIEVAVEDLEAAEKRLMELVQKSGGYISRSEMGSNPGARRQGSWTLRIPGNKASDLASGIVALGEPIRQSSDARDVSEEFYDLEARIKNKKTEEERLIQHLKDSTGKLADILAVEKEITRVRGEIEQAQGRLNMLANLTSLATVQVTLIEHKNYKPEPAPTFLTKAARTFHQSLDGLYDSLARFSLWIISWSPWLAFWGIIIALGRVIWIVRKASAKS